MFTTINLYVLSLSSEKAAIVELNLQEMNGHFDRDLYCIIAPQSNLTNGCLLWP